MFDPADLPAEGFARLVAVMARLRDRGQGCPWDLEQTLHTLRPYLIEESYEALDAIDALGPAADALPGDQPHADRALTEAHREELGDVLLQIVFQARVAEEMGFFDAEAVARGVADKMIYRHPHVFVQAEGADAPTGPATITDAAAVVDQWEQIKRKDGRGALAGVPRHLPALLRAHRIGEKAARIGFDWQQPDDVIAKVEEELGEVREALARGDLADLERETGDLLFAVASLARHHGLDAENALRGTLDRFSSRFGHVERRLDASGSDKGAVADLEAWWREAKQLEAKQLEAEQLEAEQLEASHLVEQRAAAVASASDASASNGSSDGRPG